MVFIAILRYNANPFINFFEVSPIIANDSSTLKNNWKGSYDLGQNY